MKYLLSIIYILFLSYIFIVYYYNIIISLFCLKKNKICNDYTTDIKNTFLILIPCHNEEDVIYGNLESFNNSTYDKSKYKILVICDNCSDDTVRNVERTASQSKCDVEIIEVKGGSKPKAINTALEYIKKDGMYYNYDNIVFMDSDNKCSPNMLSAFNYYHSKGNPILQVRIRSDNDDSIISKGFTSSFNSMTYGFQIARNNIGLSGSLCGTGFSVNRVLFDKIGFEDCHTLTEDLEFSMKFILAGYRIKFISNEYVKNQNLDSVKPSIIQRIRWCRGHSAVSREYSRKLLLKFIKTLDIQYIDSFIFLTSTSRSILSVIVLLLSFITKSHAIIITSVISIIYQILFCLYCNRMNVKYIIPQAIHMFIMTLVMPYSYITKNNNKWVKTKHVRIN